MNRWHIYEYMKHVYMRTGFPPTTETLRNEFPEVSIVEIREGVLEFEGICGTTGNGNGNFH